jgi:hypothetical protein
MWLYLLASYEVPACETALRYTGGLGMRMLAFCSWHTNKWRLSLAWVFFYVCCPNSWQYLSCL